MLLGVIADDFTGAGDIANTIARGRPGEGGLLSTQYIGVPDRPAAAGTEAGIVALKSRSIPAADAVAQSLAALGWLREQGCRQFVIKYCSTFDSTPEGNIGPVAEALSVALGVKGVVACPAFPASGRTVYQGHLFVGDRLLNESGLQNHPLNRMTDPDIRRWLARQSRTPVGLAPLPVVRSGPEALAKALATASSRGETLVIVDAVEDDDLLTIGRASAASPLITGGSGIALGLPANFIAAGLASGSDPRMEPVTGPEAILAGSCSAATLDQIAHHGKRHPSLAIEVESLMRGNIEAANLAAFARRHVGEAPLIYSSASPAEVNATQAAHGGAAVSAAIESLFAATARLLVEGGVRRLVVAGGETSGAVVSALALRSLVVGPEIETGVPVLVADKTPRLALALKSGNFGSPLFFETALERLAKGG